VKIENPAIGQIKIIQPTNGHLKMNLKTVVNQFLTIKFRLTPINSYSGPRIFRKKDFRLFSRSKSVQQTCLKAFNSYLDAQNREYYKESAADQHSVSNQTQRRQERRDDQF